MHRQFAPNRLIARPLFVDLFFEVGVNLFDDREVAWQQAAHQLFIPTFQRFWHQRMVGISESIAGDCPSRIPIQLMLI
ncbi:hypothetical protein D3C71_2040240 [compost metagenome]